MKSIEKKDKDKRLIQNLKNVFLSLISDNQLAFVDGRFITEGGRLISNVLQITDVLKLNVMLVTVDIQKALDSVNHQFLALLLKRYGFSKTFIKWIKTLK